MIHWSAVCIMFAVGLLGTSAFGSVRLASVLGDNMVLQQGVAAPIWGTASPGESITVSFAGQTLNTAADAQGKWQVRLAAMSASSVDSGQELTVSGSDRVTIKNILVGEVWVCSGQSNMEWSLEGTANGTAEADAATFPQIRMFTVEKTASPEPMDACPSRGGWIVCTPERARNFSAVAYYFAKELHQRLKVPVGILTTAWSGTRAEPWVSLESLKAMPVYHQRLAEYENTRAGYLADKERMDREHERDTQQFRAHQKWFDKLTAEDPGLKFYNATSWPEDGWEEIELPVTLAKHPFPHFTGITWYRKEVEIPESWLGKRLKISMPPRGDMSCIWLEGRDLNYWWAHDGYWGGEGISCDVPASLVRSRKLNFIVRSYTDKTPAFLLSEGTNNESRLSVSLASNPEQSVSLAGSWKYQHTATLDRATMPPLGRNYELPGHSQDEPGTLYNAMIHPLIPYAIRGAVWYQGESNTEAAGEYRDLLSALIGSWRHGWGQGDFPFLIVQLPNFQKRQSLAVEKGDWADLREAQLKTLEVPSTGLAVTIDIGEEGNIHPTNKRDVGKRLALWALGTTYQQPIAFSGPLFKSMKIAGNQARIQFDHASGGLVAKGGKLTGFAVAGADKTFHLGDAVIDGDSVIVSCEQVPVPLVVRYAWANNPVCNLYNGESLPASPFRTDQWKDDEWKVAAGEMIAAPSEDVGKHR